MIGLSGPIGGWLQRKAPAHIIMTVAGIGFGLGWFLTGFASTIPVLYISFGLLVGVCDGICYNLALAIATRWYPDKRGFANGVALAIMAIYPLFTAPMGNMIIENFNVSIAFNIVGVFCIVGFIVLSRFLKMPAADFKPGLESAGRERYEAREELHVRPDAEDPVLLDAAAVLRHRCLHRLRDAVHGFAGGAGPSRHGCCDGRAHGGHLRHRQRHGPFGSRRHFR